MASSNNGINRISESDSASRIRENENATLSAVHDIPSSLSPFTYDTNTRNSEIIRLPSDAGVPVSRNVSEISIRSSEVRFRESELTEIPKAEVIVHTVPIARTLNDPLIPTADKPQRIFRPRFATPVLSPIRKKQGFWGSCACSFCCLFTILIYFFIPRYPSPIFSPPILTVFPNNIVSLSQNISIFNGNIYSLQVSNLDVNITLSYNISKTISFQSMNNSFTINARKNSERTLVFNNITTNLLTEKNCNLTFVKLISGSLSYKTKLHMSLTKDFSQDTRSSDDDANQLDLSSLSCLNNKKN